MARKLQRPMALRVLRQRNAHRVIARMDIVAIAGVWELAKPARRRKKAVESMAYAEISPMIKIRTKNAGADLATAKARANNTMAFLVRQNRNAYRAIASMACVAATFAICNAKPVQKRVKVKDTTAFVAQSLLEKTPTMNAIRGNAAVLAVAINNKPLKPMAPSV
jgi:hypothetical protein